MIKLSVIIPCFNESESLPKLLEICRSSIDDRDDVEFIFVNNGSRDNSRNVFETLLSDARNGFARVVDLEINKGYGNGILEGLFAAQGEVLAWTHADLQTEPKDILKAFEQYRESILSVQSIVKGTRTGRNFFDALFTFGMSVLASVMLKKWLFDINAQPKIFHRNLLQKMGNAPLDFSLDLYFLYLVKEERIKIVSYPVRFGKRLFGEAKGGGTLKGKIKLIKRTVSYIFELKKTLKKQA